jgi:hypothetical protein
MGRTDFGPARGHRALATRALATRDLATALGHDFRSVAYAGDQPHL